MAGNQKFGTFSGVFTPSILTILGVILYMRMGWVVGNAGLAGAIIIVIIAHVISVSTGLSVSSVATDKKVGAGGIYYILSRSMGIPIGGAIGLALYVGTAFSIALYLIGFAESFNGYFGFNTDINGLRLTGSVALLVLTTIALISTSVALKTQFFILAAIIISLVSIFLGTREFAPQTITVFSGAESAPLETVFAIFFPAVTGFTAGIAMSGNLQDPKKSIPVGTIAAIGVGFFVYLGIVVFLGFAVNSELLKNDYNILMKIALFSPAVVAGIWGATLSSALGGILGGPRILQAMSTDGVTPGIFGRGRGKENEPINALILVFIIAQVGILIGELDVIARVVSMFYLAAYGFINISFFLESWANPDFQPSFKVNRWIGLIGFAACFGVMFKLDMIAMFGSIIVIIGVHFWLQRKEIELETGNVWQSVWGKIVSKGLNKLETNESRDGKWNPNIILFSAESGHRPYLLELSKSVAGKTGIVTNFNLIKKGQSDSPITKVNQTIRDEELEKLGIFGRKIEVDDVYKGIENVATTFGFTGVDPNTVMMGWGKNTEGLSSFMRMTHNLIELDYNILFLDFDKEAEFGKRQTIDLWWRQTDSNNAEMMLNIARFIVQSPAWTKARIRVMFVNNSNTDNAIIKSEISKQIERMRIKAEINVITNAVAQKDFYEIVGLQSSQTDLVIIGLPDEKIAENVEFIKQTDDLFDTIGSTLLVKASDQFNRLDFNLSQDKFTQKTEILELKNLPVSEVAVINELILELDKYLEDTSNRFSEKALAPISSLYLQFIDNAEKEFEATFDENDSERAVPQIVSKLIRSLKKVNRLSTDFRTNKLSALEEIFDNEIKDFIADRKEFVINAPK
jgi:amino acid transporter